MSKIIFLSTAYPFRGGIANFTSLFYRELIKKNDVKVITYKRQYPDFLFPGKTQFDSNLSEDKIPTEQLIDSINPFNWISVGKKISEKNPDVILVSYFMWFFAPSFRIIINQIRKKRRIDVVVLAHNVISHEPKFWEKSLTKFLFKKVNLFIIMAKAVQEDLKAILPKAKSKLLFHPVYSNFGRPADKIESRKKLSINSDKVILFFGFIRDYKGLDVLLKAMAFLKEENITLLIAGEFYTDNKPYYNIINHENIKDNVLLYTDFIPASDVKYFFSAADLVILPYKSATQSGIVQIANNFHKPVIATKVGGLAESVIDGETGFVVENENPQELANAILRFYNEKRETEFIKNVKKESEKYSWENFTEEFEKEIYHLTGKR